MAPPAKRCQMTNRAYIALGTNLSHGALSGPSLLVRAVQHMEQAGLAISARSGVWRSPAWPAGADQPDYHNAVVEADVGALEPSEVFAILLGAERDFGRVRRERWGARTLDLDILAAGELAGVFGGIELPHPRMTERAFVILPLAEIAPGWRHPVSRRTASELAEALPPGHACQRVCALAGN